MFDYKAWQLVASNKNIKTQAVAVDTLPHEISHIWKIYLMKFLIFGKLHQSGLKLFCKCLPLHESKIDLYR